MRWSAKNQFRIQKKSEKDSKTVDLRNKQQQKITFVSADWISNCINLFLNTYDLLGKKDRISCKSRCMLERISTISKRVLFENVYDFIQFLFSLRQRVSRKQNDEDCWQLETTNEKSSIISQLKTEANGTWNRS